MSLWKYPISLQYYIDEIRGFHLTIGDIKNLNVGDTLEIVCFDYNLDILTSHIPPNKVLSANTFFKSIIHMKYIHTNGLQGMIQKKDIDVYPTNFEFSIECKDNMWFPLKNGKVQPNIYSYWSDPEFYDRLWTEFPDTTRISCTSGPIVCKKHMKYFPKIYKNDGVELYQKICTIINT